MATCPKCYGYLHEAHRCPKPLWVRTLTGLLASAARLTGAGNLQNSHARARSATPHRATDSPRVPRVLIVDDEASVRGLLVRWLNDWGYDTRQAADTTEALAIISRVSISILLCDIQMPGQDGLWLVKHVRARWPHLAIVMVSGVGDFDKIIQSRELGAIDYVSKPFNRALLHQALERTTASTNQTTCAGGNDAFPPGP